MTKDLRDAFDESEEIEESDIVVLVDEDDVEHRLVMLAVVEYEDQDYALLAPEEELADDSKPELDLYIFQYDVDDEGVETFQPIPDDARFDEVREFCSTLIDTDALSAVTGGVVPEA
ncbi:MAG: DUF1292 domain-containing protein [Deltaproteobacteria bacterium]|nr:MAG: DUF1292 domain-containing protein [Deltaproteobacteria bacterium]